MLTGTNLVTVWDPFETLWLPHDARISGWVVLVAYIRRMEHMYRVTADPQRWPAEAEKISRAAWALRTGLRRRQILADLAVQPGLLSGLGFDRGRAELADGLLTPLAGAADLEKACDRRALEREAARMRLECLVAGKRPWPPAAHVPHQPRRGC